MIRFGNCSGIALGKISIPKDYCIFSLVIRAVTRAEPKGHLPQALCQAGMHDCPRFHPNFRGSPGCFMCPIPSPLDAGQKESGHIVPSPVHTLLGRTHTRHKAVTSGFSWRRRQPWQLQTQPLRRRNRVHKMATTSILPPRKTQKWWHNVTWCCDITALGSRTVC